MLEYHAAIMTAAVHLFAVNLDLMVADCLAMVAPLAQSHGVRSHALAPCAEWVWADRTRVKQVLLNLLANAIKYNVAGGDVAVEVRRDGDSVRVAVRDSGPGLSSEQRERLFQPFERLAATGSNVEGTGIGLALSRRLVQAMGGTIGVDSAVGRGSVFWVRLPRADAGAPVASRVTDVEGAAPRTQAASALQWTVLYVEDNPVNMLLMEAMLGRLRSVTLLSAATPERGLALARNEQPDLILLDIQLPGMNGFELQQRLRADPRTRAIPTIAVTANAMQIDLDAGAAAGFAAYLTKPVELEQLLTTVQRVLHEHSVGVPHNK